MPIVTLLFARYAFHSKVLGRVLEVLWLCERRGVRVGYGKLFRDEDVWGFLVVRRKDCRRLPRGEHPLVSTLPALYHHLFRGG